MMKSKKAISAVVATVLIILITVAAVTIIWAAVIPMIQQNIQGSTECFEADASFSIGSDYSCVNKNDTAYAADIQVKRKQGDYDLEELKLVVGCEGNTNYTIKTTVPEAGGSKLYTDTEINNNTLGLACIDSATVAAIVKAGQSIEECSSGQTVEISECPSED